ncbi:ganglioside GM2 activator [Octopus sinensis]|uniref:Ganglioside GM2 activator n=1 Tax=Octopus sinensis TaxID=2607531 RepID=A0A6P7SRW5_9MOLL|nr:ganglioside GM2 activator [Octopus sinensis]
MYVVQLLCMFCAVCVCLSRDVQFEWSYCNGKSKVIKIKNLKIWPTPLKSPGKFYVDIDEETTQTLNSSRIEIKVKKLGFIDLPVPCITNFGSCTYPDSCTVLNEMEKYDYGGLMGPISQTIKKMFDNNGVVHKCPVPPQKFSVKQAEFSLPKTSRIMKRFLKGNFEAQVRMIDNGNKAEFFCMKFRISVDTGCTGWFCFR